MNQLARLRPDKFDDKTVKEQISLIQQSCGENIDPDQIAIVFHECDYNMQKTIQRICSGEFEDSEWQTAKSTHKKKIHHQNEVITNGQHRLTTRTMNNHRSAKFDRKPPQIIDQSKQDKEKLLIKPKIIISSIPSEPVRMHSAVKYSSQPIDVQFGDIQWNDSIPQIDEFDHNTSPDSSSSSSSNIVEETILTNQSSITDNTISNLLSTDNTSHLSDQLAEPSSVINSDQQNQPIDIPITRLPPTSTPRMPEYPPQYIPPTTSYNTYSSLPANQWNMQTSNYRTNSKGNMHSSTSYQLPTQQQQQQVFVGAYPYPTLSPTLVQVFAPIEHWSHNGYTAPIESYTYSTTNYITAYPNQPSQTKYDQQSYDKEHLNSTQANKDTHLTSKLSPTAVAFSQGVPLTASPSTTALYINPIPFPMPSYYHPHHPSTSGLSMENHDNHSNISNRTNYYQHAQTSRTYNTHVSNSTWHPQQSM